MSAHKKIKRISRHISAQTFLEYTLLFGIIVVVLVAMTPMVRRATQSMVKLVADQVGNQVNAEQRGGDSGYLVVSNAAIDNDSRKRTRERVGETWYDYNDRVGGGTTVIANLGFSGQH